MSEAAPLILLCAGGTGGHMFPARALAEELLARGYRVALACDTRGLKYFDGMGQVDIHVLASGTYKPGLMGKIGFVLPLLKGYAQAFKLMRTLKPALAVGFGGYPSAPPLWAAQHSRIRTILHEQNAILGLANILLIGRARVLALSWEKTTGVNPKFHKKMIVTGNPVRAEIAALHDQPYPEIKDKINIMVVGGSQGAAVFSDIVPKAFAALPADMKARLRVVQQSRPDKVDEVKAFYAEQDIDAEVQAFFSDMPDRIRDTHFMITRSGASTVAELTTAGRPALYVPYPWNRDNQQVFNAQAVLSVGGGWMIQEKNLTVGGLVEALKPLFENPSMLARTAHSARTIGQPQAAKRMADAVLQQLPQK